MISLLPDTKAPVRLWAHEHEIEASALRQLPDLVEIVHKLDTILCVKG